MRTDKQYLVTQQYRTASNLLARITLHERFSINPYDWFAWVYDHFDLPGQAKIIEVGCGPGYLWNKNISRIPPEWNITLTDLSHGMIEEARKNLSKNPNTFVFIVINAEQIPTADCQFDAVIANHMLYHVPDRVKAISEFHRILKPNGLLYCSTNGSNHLTELDALFDQLLSASSGNTISAFSASAFTLENGVSQMSPLFQVDTAYYNDALHITEAKPLIEYILSMIPDQKHSITQKQIDQLHQEIEERILRDGYIHISKSTGLFIAHKTS
jgi:ubiquinone/menaquinone biosynthesis C-methylase UbiE